MTVQTRNICAWDSGLLFYVASIIVLPGGLAQAQTNIYLRDSGPQSQVVVGATNATPVVLTTQSPHGFSSSCNATTNICYCAVVGAATGTGVSPANGVRECVYQSPDTLALYDTSGNPIAGNGDWFAGYTPYPNPGQDAQWVAPLTRYTIPANAGPLGFFDGRNGDLMRRLATSTANGLSSIVVSGGSGGSCASTPCTVTVNLSYDPTTMRIPLAAGNQFSITGTYSGSGADLDTCGSGGGAQSPFTVASVSSSSYTSTSFTCSGLTTGTYTGVHVACGPKPTPDDTIGGSQDCAVVSLLGLNNNAWWTQMLTYMTYNGLTSSPTYKTVFDGGSMVANQELASYYAMAAIRFLVDRSNSLWLSEVIYGLNNIARAGGVGFAVNSQSFVFQSDSNFNYTTGIEGLAILYAVAAHAPEGAYWANSEQAAFLNEFYADVDDPTVSACTTANQDAASTSTHNWVLSSGLVASGSNDSTHVQLPSSDPHYATTGYYVNTVVQLDNAYGGGSDYSHYTYGLVTAHSSTGVLTVSSWVDPAGGSGVTPTMQQVVSATYVSGLSVTGSTGQYACVITGGNAWILFPLSGANTVSTASNAGIILAPGLQTSGAPTSASSSQNCSTVQSISGTATISTTVGTKYTIFDTFRISSRTSGATATATFTKSNPSTLLNPGDEIVALDGWYNETSFPRWGSYVSSCGSTSCTVINADGVTASTSTPQMAWRLPQYTNGDCGWLWAAKHQQNASIGVQAAVYGYGGGGQTGLNNNSGTYSVGDTGANGGNGGSPGAAFMALDLAAASDDSRAVRDLARVQSWAFDYACRPLLDFSTGRLRDGPGYSMDADTPSCELFEWLLYDSVPSFPTWYGTWAQNISLWKMYTALPQLFGGSIFMAGWAGQIGAGYGGWQLFGNSAASYGWAFDPVSFFAPTSNNAGWYRNFNENYPSGSLWGNTEPDRQALAVLHNDPRIADSTYSTPPLQAVFDQSSSSQLTTLTGWPHLYRGDAAVSRNCWQCSNGSLTIFDAASFTNGSYDSPRAGQVSIWENGCLLGGDSNPCNSLWASDSSTLGDTVQLGGPGLSQFQSGIQPSIALTPITAWASANASAYGSMFGDSQSRYAAACTSEAANYNQTNLNIILDHAVRCWVHLKKPGNDEWIFQFDDVALAGGSPTPAITMNWHLHYPQNGQVQAPSGINYPTGSTVCTALSGATCTSNTIKEIEDGNNGRTYGLMTWIASPNTITVIDDCVGRGGGQCAPGSTYPGGNGYTHRFTVAGGTSAGASVSKMLSVAGHKMMSGLTDTTFNTSALNPDANWTGVQLTGARSTGIALFAVGGSAHSSMASFTTSFSGTGDWLIMGLTPGIYSLTVAGVPVAGSPFTVGSGDGTIYFSSGAGTVVLNSGSLPPPVSPTSVQGQMSITGNMLIH